MNLTERIIEKAIWILLIICGLFILNTLLFPEKTISDKDNYYYENADPRDVLGTPF